MECKLNLQLPCFVVDHERDKLCNDKLCTVECKVNGSVKYSHSDPMNSDKYNDDVYAYQGVPLLTS